ncbi:MAG TPA: RagB/SusD family nutrient uptake outer membrane protein, partial [Chitinophagaceae bacterium]|nr:RagB/SusD family nutrient uptake outer membrane protein [Chitinophagaceae bacterium]
TRRSYNYPGLTNVTGYNAGLLIGQQFGPGGVALTTRQGKPLIFTKEVKLKETDANTLELTGVRVIKYIPQFQNNDPSKPVEFPADNDYVIFRYADVLLMKAEAIMRGGTATSVAPAAPLLLVNAIRAKRGASVLTNLTEQILLDERSRELYIEGWRRNDLIRFGKFLQPWTEKGQSDPSRLVFPIPNEQLAINPNLEQNPGY